jgi:multiple sugar transport system permease protein
MGAGSSSVLRRSVAHDTGPTSVVTSVRPDRHVVPATLMTRTAVALVLGFFVLFFAVPIIWLLMAPSKTPSQLTSLGPLEFGSVQGLSANWSTLVHFEHGVIFRWLWNSATYSLSALAIALCTSIPAGYALAHGQFRGRRLLLKTTLIVMLMPSTALVLPIFLELAAVHLVGTAYSVILPFSFFPFGVYLTYVYFSTSVPREVLDAARIDGCTEVAVFTRVALPLGRPVIALVGFFGFVASWNSFLLPFLMLSGSRVPIQVGLTDLLSGVPDTTLALATLLAVAPALLVFVLSQRFLARGLGGLRHAD